MTTVLTSTKKLGKVTLGGCSSGTEIKTRPKFFMIRFQLDDVGIKKPGRENPFPVSK